MKSFYEIVSGKWKTKENTEIKSVKFNLNDIKTNFESLEITMGKEKIVPRFFNVGILNKDKEEIHVLSYSINNELKTSFLEVLSDNQISILWGEKDNKVVYERDAIVAAKPTAKPKTTTKPKTTAKTKTTTKKTTTKKTQK